MNVIVATWSIGAPSPRAPELNFASRLQLPDFDTLLLKGSDTR